MIKNIIFKTLLGLISIPIVIICVIPGMFYMLGYIIIETYKEYKKEKITSLI